MPAGVVWAPWVLATGELVMGWVRGELCERQVCLRPCVYGRTRA